jgi:hypothetical protein
MTSKPWQNYEEVAIYLLNQMAEKFGLGRVEGKQKIVGGRSGTSWAIDGKGVKVGNEGFLIVECRRYTQSKQTQEDMGALAYRIIDTGASGGIIVSPLGVQAGGAKVNAAENIHTVRLDENSTETKFILKFLNETFVGTEKAVSPETARPVKPIKGSRLKPPE